ncbi:MAG: hypothetical protein Q7I99_05310 [Acholeplasmataceae bacterium]|nr:hypothetical protein [Acholeplasmataceae bacterium]
MGQLDKNMLTQVNENLELLNEIRKNYDCDFTSQYNEFVNRTTRNEYSKGGVNNTFGYYSFDLFDELIITNYRKGKIYNHEISGFDYKYSFQESKLIMIEQFDNAVRVNSYFLHHLKSKKYIIGYLSMNLRTNSKPSVLMLCIYDDKDRLMKFLYGGISGDRISNYEERLYQYSKTEFMIQEYSYHYWSGVSHVRDFTFPLSVLDDKAEQQVTKKISNKMIKRVLKDNWISIMQSWNIKSGYAISVILHNRMTIEIDYAEEDESNQAPYSEQRWDYTYWNQNSKSLLQNEYDKKVFEAWLEQHEESNLSNQSLTENTKFLSILSSIIKELKEESFIKTCFKKEVPVIVTNFDHDDSILKLNLKLNNRKLIEGYSKWFEQNIKSI